MRNQGLAARNTAFQLSRTENVLVLDADNLLLPKACAHLLSALESRLRWESYPLLAVEGHSSKSGE